MNNTIFIDCGNFTEPTDIRECWEVIWSNCTSCRKCPNKACYRNGWLKPRVTEDNAKIVKKVAEIRNSYWNYLEKSDK